MPFPYTFPFDFDPYEWEGSLSISVTVSSTAIRDFAFSGTLLIQLNIERAEWEEMMNEHGGLMLIRLSEIGVHRSHKSQDTEGKKLIAAWILSKGLPLQEYEYIGAIGFQNSLSSLYHHAISASYNGSINLNCFPSCLSAVVPAILGTIQTSINLNSIYSSYRYLYDSQLDLSLLASSRTYSSWYWLINERGQKVFSGLTEYGSKIIEIIDESGHVFDEYPPDVYVAQQTITLQVQSIVRVDHSYTGSITATLNVSHSIAVTFATVGVTSVALTPASVYFLGFEYSGSVLATLLPASVYSLTCVYTGSVLATFGLSPSIFYIPHIRGAIQTSLLPASLYVKENTYSGSVNVVLLPSSLLTVHYQTTGSVTATITPASLYLYYGIIEYSGQVLTQLLPQSLFSQHFQRIGITQITLSPESQYKQEFQLVGYILYNLIPQSAYEFKVFEKEYVGISQFELKPNSPYYYEVAFDIKTYYYEIINEIEPSEVLDGSFLYNFIKEKKYG